MPEPKMELEDWLDDLCVRFIINLPSEDLSSVARICFQVEEAQWFYEDFIRPLDPTLPSMSLRTFCLRIFQHCPLLSSFSVKDHARAFEDFLTYKTRVPVRGAIMLNEAMDSAVLVKGWKKGANWSFPRGKINKDEDDLDCAIREVYEETGFDIRGAGLVPRAEEVKYIDITMREQQLRLYVFRNVPMDTHFEPKTRKEISKIQWYRLSELPAFRKKGGHQQEDPSAAASANKFYMVAPFLVPLKKWVVQQKKRDAARRTNNGSSLSAQPILEEALTEDDMGTHTEPGPVPDIEPVRAAPAVGCPEGDSPRSHPLFNVGSSVAHHDGSQTASLPVSIIDPGHAKGKALLAILQQPRAAPPAPVSYQPHMPVDHMYNETSPEPRTRLHYLPAQVASEAKQSPSPNFPLNMHAGRNYTVPYLNNQILSTQRPVGDEGPSIESAHPIPVPDRLPNNMGASPHSRPLLLQVANMPPESVSYQPPQAPDPTAATQQAAGESRSFPHLSVHSISLLNAFRNKSDQGSAVGMVTTELSALEQPAPGQSRIQPQTKPPAQTLLHAQSKGPVPTDQHLSTLLGIFKPQSRITAEAPPIGMVDGAGPSPVMSTAGHTLQPSHPVSTADAIEAAADANGGPIQMNPNQHLPFGALKLLSRPKGLERGDTPGSANEGSQAEVVPESSMTHQAQFEPRLEHQMQMRTLGLGQGGTVESLGIKTHDGGRPPQFPPMFQTRGLTAGRLPRVIDEPPGSAAALSLQTTKLFPNPSSLLNTQATSPAQLTSHMSYTPPRQQPEQTADQKNVLLSLFGKLRGPAISHFSSDAPSIEEGKSRQPSPILPLSSGTYSQILAAASAPKPADDRVRPDSLLAGVVTASGESSRSGPTSRRNSPVPISPADRSFLLDYLQSVAHNTNP